MNMVVEEVLLPGPDPAPAIPEPTAMEEEEEVVGDAGHSAVPMGEGDPVEENVVLPPPPPVDHSQASQAFASQENKALSMRFRTKP